LEGALTAVRKVFFLFAFLGFLGPGFSTPGEGLEDPGGELGSTPPRLMLRKAIKTPKIRQFKGQSVKGEERIILFGDSLWKMLIQEKGLSEEDFHQYLVIIRSLNPDLKNPNILRIGDLIFIPLQPDEMLEAKSYQVKRREHLFKILRRQLGLRKTIDLVRAYAKVRRLNPHKKNWDRLFVGETILLPRKTQAQVIVRTGEAPAAEQEEQPSVKLQQAREVVGLDYGLKLPVHENLNILKEIVAVLGNQMTQEGEETLALKEGRVHIDRGLFPIVQDARSKDKLVLNVEEKIRPIILSQIESENPGVMVVPVKKGSSLHEAANTLLSRLGFQSLPSEHPVVLQDKGVGLHVKGEWMVTSPEEHTGKQAMWIISLTDKESEVPTYIKDYLSLKGVNIEEILLHPGPVSVTSDPVKSRSGGTQRGINSWPRDKRALVDALLKTYQITFSSDTETSLSLKEGMRVDAKIDRLFEFGTRKYAILFRKVGQEMRMAIERDEGIVPIELDLESLSSRELIAGVLQGLGEPVAYQENRFPVNKDEPIDKLVFTVLGFYLPDRSLLLTDQQIPEDLQTFFYEQGLQLISFQ
jgi:hypothetical protein